MSGERMKIGLLGRADSLMMGYILREMAEKNVAADAVLMDSKTLGEKGRKIQEERTGGKMPILPLHEFEALRIPFYFVEDHTSDRTVRLIRDLGLDLLVNAGTPRILKGAVLQAPKVGIVSCHPGLLPQFRGCTCVEWAVYLDEPVGNTVHFITEGIDEGPIILQEQLGFTKQDTYTDVRVKVFRHAAGLMARGLRRVQDEQLSPSVLPPQGEGRYFKVMESEKLQDVMRKLADGRYRFQE